MIDGVPLRRRCASYEVRGYRVFPDDQDLIRMEGAHTSTDRFATRAPVTAWRYEHEESNRPGSLHRRRSGGHRRTGRRRYYLFNQPTDYRITYELHGLSGDETIRYQDTAFAEGFVFGTKETEETVVDARAGAMTIEAIVTEGDEAGCRHREPREPPWRARSCRTQVTRTSRSFARTRRS
ncbi:hypothetical protein AB1285_26075, partial [Microbacterium sp. NRRL B-14842]|uniref:hypothetical protein n=1 Tax=Microbacterium sp. NRRL B-14842 TaxID=3162881 RepID=UPI003D27FF1C